MVGVRPELASHILAIARIFDASRQGLERRRQHLAGL
jgi:hypothetical protein